MPRFGSRLRSAGRAPCEPMTKTADVNGAELVNRPRLRVRQLVKISEQFYWGKRSVEADSRHFQISRFAMFRRSTPRTIVHPHVRLVFSDECADALARAVQLFVQDLGWAAFCLAKAPAVKHVAFTRSWWAPSTLKRLTRRYRSTSGCAPPRVPEDEHRLCIVT